MPAPFLLPPLVVPDPGAAGERQGACSGAMGWLTLTAYSWLVMRLMQVCTRAWAPSQARPPAAGRHLWTRRWE